MTPAELRDARESLGLTQTELAALLGVAGDGTVSRWERGVRAIDGPVSVLLELLLRSPQARKLLGVTLEE